MDAAEVAYSVGVSADSFLSIIVLGYLFDALLMGIVLHQVSAYFQNFPNHRTIIQRMVRVILLFCVVQTICNMVSCMHSLGLNGDPLGLFSYIFTSGAVLVSRICNPWLMGIAHVLLAHRCLAFTSSLRVWNTTHMLVFRWALWAATIICWVFGLTGIAIIFSAFRSDGVVIGPVPQLVKVGHVMLICNLVSASILDSIIAAVMIYELHHSKSAFQGTKSVVETMSRILVANGFLLTVYQLAIALAYAFGTVSNSSGFTIVANDLIGKIYAITSLLAICRPLEAERLRQNPQSYAYRARGSGEQTSPSGDESSAARKTAGGESTTVFSSVQRRRSSMRPADSDDDNDLEAAIGTDDGMTDKHHREALNPAARSSESSTSDAGEDVDEKDHAGSNHGAGGSSIGSDADCGVATLRFIESSSGGSPTLPPPAVAKRGGLASLGLNLHPSGIAGKFGSTLSPSSSRGSVRPHTAPSTTCSGRPSFGASGGISYASSHMPLAPNGAGLSPSTYGGSPPTPVRTMLGLDNDHGLDLNYICAPMDEDGAVVKSLSPARGPSPRLFD